MDPVRLTQYSRGAGCGCKISPQVLQEILQTDMPDTPDPRLLVGLGTKDDAAAYDLGNNQVLISTTDFFMPIVDDAFDFGRIAAANALSDVYAMGGKPILALAILGWPIEKLPAPLAARVLDGARTICSDAGIVLAGGHSIDSAEPIFGLSVTGMVTRQSLKTNAGAREGDWLYLTKPLGAGVYATALKRDKILPDHLTLAIQQMTTVNSLGERLGARPEVHALTDITGFGLLGHLLEMAEAAGLSAELYYDRIPAGEGVKEYIAQRIVPDATFRNWNSYSAKVGFEKGVPVMEAFSLLPDPQTNGGLLISVSEAAGDHFEQWLISEGFAEFCKPIGQMTAKVEKEIQVRMSTAS